MSLRKIKDDITPDLKRKARALSPAGRTRALEAMGMAAVSLGMQAFSQPGLRAAAWAPRKDNLPHKLLQKSTTLRKSLVSRAILLAVIILIIILYRPGQLGEEHGRQMAHDAEGPRLRVYAGLPGDPVDHPPRNELEKLVEDDIIGAGWCLFLFHTPTEWQGFKPGTSPFFTQIQEILWDACESLSWISSQFALGW